MNMNKELCEDVIEIERLLRNIEEEKKRLVKENQRTWDQLVWMAAGYLDREWEVKLNSNGKIYSSELKTFVDKGMECVDKKLNDLLAQIEKSKEN